jgi:hypothetical protein
MNVLYYIGGPWDLTKKALEQAPRQREIYMLEPTKALNYAELKDSDPVDFCEMRRHRYVIRQVGYEVFLAVHESIT